MKVVLKDAPELLKHLPIMVTRDKLELSRCLDMGRKGIENMLATILGRETFQELGLDSIDYG
jgi:hypothetical protein